LFRKNSHDEIVMTNKNNQKLFNSEVDLIKFLTKQLTNSNNSQNAGQKTRKQKLKNNKKSKRRR
jgi:hypothetical protein